MSKDEQNVEIETLEETAAEEVVEVEAVETEEVEAIEEDATTEEADTEEAEIADEAVVVEEEVAEEDAPAIEIEVPDYSNDLDALVEGEEALSEDFRAKAGVIFEAAYTSKVTAEIDRLEEKYTENLESEIAEITDGLVEKVDSYLSYVVEQWMESNEVAIKNGLRTEIAEDFIQSLQTVFKESYVEVPEGKVDLVDELADEVNELKEALNKSTEGNIRLHESVRDLTRAEIVRKASQGLATTDAEKLASLVDDVEFTDAETFEMKVGVIADSYFNTGETIKTESDVEQAIGNEDSNAEALTGPMAAYTRALNSNG
jgi:hypothetical protein